MYMCIHILQFSCKGQGTTFGSQLVLLPFRFWGQNSVLQALLQALSLLSHLDGPVSTFCNSLSSMPLSSSARSCLAVGCLLSRPWVLLWWALERAFPWLREPFMFQSSWTLSHLSTTLLFSITPTRLLSISFPPQDTLHACYIHSGQAGHTKNTSNVGSVWWMNASECIILLEEPPGVWNISIT
jgi:hypothetical protein